MESVSRAAPRSQIHLLDHIKDYAILEVDRVGTILSWNTGAMGLFGYPAAQIIGRSVDFLRPDGRPSALKALMEQASLDGSARSFGWQGTLGGSLLWVESSCSVIQDHTGRLTGFALVMREATREAETEAKLHALLESTAYAVVATSTEGLITLFNGAAERLLGYSAAELIDQCTPLVFHDPAEIAVRASQVSAELGRSIIPGFDTLVAWTREHAQADERPWIYLHKDGSRVPVLLSTTALRDPRGHVTGYLGIARDMSELSHARHELIKQEQERDRLLQVIESSSDLIGIADLEGRILYGNPAADSLLGYAPGERNPKRVDEVHPAWAGELVRTTAIPTVLREGRWMGESALLHKDGSEIPVSQLVMLHRDSSGNPAHISTVMRDLRALKRAESLLDKVAAQVPGMLFQLEFTAKGEFHFPYVSDGVLQLYGMTAAQLAKGAAGIPVHPEDGPLISSTLQASAASLTAWSADFRVNWPPGTERWHRSQATPERMANGAVVWHGFTTDITDERRSLEELRRAKLALEDAIAALDAGFAMYDADERLVICNENFANLYKLSPEVSSLHPTYEQMIRDEFVAHPEYLLGLPPEVTFEEWLTQRLIEFRMPKAPRLMEIFGRWIRLEERKTKNGSTICVRTDVTALKQTEFEVRLQEQRLRLATTAAGIGIWETDLTTGQLVWDTRMQELFHFSPGTFPGTMEAWKGRIHPDDLADVELEASTSLANGSDFRDKYRIILPNGEVRHIERRGTLVRDSDSTVIRRVGINLDVTDEVKKEQALRDAVSAAVAASKAKAEFLATMSHEIRTPLNGVIGMTGLLLTTELDANQREYTDVIRSSGEGLLSLINDIMDFSKIEAGKLELEEVVFPLDQVARDVVTLFREQAATKGIELLWELPEVGTLVKGDSTRLRQILLNITSNALKFTQRGSVRVCVRAPNEFSPDLPVEVEVTDTGVGMSEKTLARLGEPFTQADSSTTRQFGGTGLGLSICKSLVQLMNGSWQVTSELGKGTSFLIRLPLRYADSAVRERYSLPAPQRALLEAVLVAEDNVVNQRVVSLMLKKHAKRVDLANDGREALEMFKSGTYDVVFMDGQMPNMDGLESTRLIRAHEVRSGAERTPIVALTANALPGDRETFLAAGMDYYLTKPVRPKDLERALQALEPERVR